MKIVSTHAWERQIDTSRHYHRLRLGMLVEIAALLAAIASGGAGHGHYAAARALFPVPMLLTLLQDDSIGTFSMVVGLLQFPIYGGLAG